MKNKRKSNPFFYMAITLLVLFVILIAFGISMFFYVFMIPDPDGLSLASWPNTFTDNFSLWMNYENGFTVFVNRFDTSDTTLSYLVGFPYSVGKSLLYYNGEHVARLSPLAKTVILLASGAIVLCGFVYSFWLSRKLSIIVGSIRTISQHRYRPLKETGVFGEVYGSLNQMDVEIRRNIRIQEETDRTRNEWISNITHDLKTPLSPIKGYAELLADGSGQDIQTVQNYGKIILKNADHIEKLMNDLKLTYQLEAGAIPYTPQKTKILRFLKELIIDILNDPAFSDREVEFESDMQETAVGCDPNLLRRAISNIIINALVHNPPDTRVKVTVNQAQKNRIAVCICDNGTGMNETELSDLWNRYYRGTSTKEKPEGSGLGLAIAKQIVTLHGGEITVRSKPGAGTRFAITLPLETEPDGN